MTELLVESEPIISYDPARMGGDISAVLITEKQTITQTDLFENPITFNRYRVLASYDLKGQDYLKQIDELARIVKKVREAFRKDPAILCDVTGNEGLADALRAALPGVRLCKFSGEMSKEMSHTGGYRMLNKPVWVTKLSLLLEQDRIIIDSEMSSAKELKKQLEQFTATFRASGSVGYEAKGSGHDDFVSCLLMTIAERKGAFTIELPHPVQHVPNEAIKYEGY